VNFLFTRRNFSVNLSTGNGFSEMNATFVFAGVVGASLLGGFIYVFLRLSQSGRSTQVDLRWLAAFSPSRYRPMERLLTGNDLAFLAAQPGYTQDLGRRFRAERRRVFRVYLSNLVRDFERLHRAARVLVLNAPEDRPDFAAALVRQRILFERTMILVRWRLFLNLLSGAEVDVSGLVRTLDAMSVQVRSLAAVPTPA